MNENAMRYTFRKGPAVYTFLVHESGDVQVEAFIDGVRTRRFTTEIEDARVRIARLKSQGFTAKFS